MLTIEQANHFAGDWIAAWNAHDLNRILSHYRDDVSFVSAFAIDHAGARDGVVRTLPALRRYFERALAAYPDLRFELIAALPGVDSVALHYRSVDGRQAIEVMELDARGRVQCAAVHYSAPAISQANESPEPGRAERDVARRAGTTDFLVPQAARGLFARALNAFKALQTPCCAAIRPRNAGRQPVARPNSGGSP